MLIAAPPPKALFIKLNILIDQDGCARLADFGLLTIVLDSTDHTSSTTPKSAGTTRWMSPELLDPCRFGRENGQPTEYSDCYALGMVILEVLTGNPPFPNCNGLVVMRNVVEGEHPGRPRGGEGVWFTDDLWEMLKRCWSLQPERRPTVDTVLQCLEQGSTAWQPLPPDSDDYTQSDSDDQSDFTLSYDPSSDSSMFLHFVSYLAHPQTTFVVARIDRQDDDQILVLFQAQSHAVYAGQDSCRRSPERQQGLAEPPVSITSDMVECLFYMITRDMF